MRVKYLLDETAYTHLPTMLRETDATSSSVPVLKLVDFYIFCVSSYIHF